MHREAKIYIGFAVGSLALTAFWVERLVVLTQRPFVLIDAVLFGAAAIVFLALTAFYAMVAFAFAARFIDRVKKDTDSVFLLRPNGTSIQVNGNVRVIRRFGKQFSFNEDQPVFVLFLANRHLWVSPKEEAENGV